ncbi:MAG TPA: hypothetical protein VFQ51_10980 [Vicinamibacteria bacterium]|nr:hypothetical protein [Vicinamibacteria bacterium]
MATLEDAAAELVTRLKGLDSEIEESQHALEKLRAGTVEISGGVDQEWARLTEAVTSFLDTLREEEERMTDDVREALQATGDARGNVQEDGSEARADIAEAGADLDALAQHATALQPGLESLVTESGEAPARALAARAQEVERELAQALEDARTFLADEGCAALDEVADEIRQRCQALKGFLEERAGELDAATDEFEHKVDQLEQYVATHAFQASRDHARAVVEWALAEFGHGSDAQLEGLGAVVAEAVAALQELAAEVAGAGVSLAGQGAELGSALSGPREAIVGAVSALDSVKELLAGLSFLQA